MLFIIAKELAKHHFLKSLVVIGIISDCHAELGSASKHSEIPKLGNIILRER
jgi:hypothetical protein